VVVIIGRELTYRPAASRSADGHDGRPASGKLKTWSERAIGALLFPDRPSGCRHGIG
jgi:hypothetical protein